MNRFGRFGGFGARRFFVLGGGFAHLIVLLLLIAAIVAVIAFVAWLLSERRGPHHHHVGFRAPSREDDSIRTLRQRYANGELTSEEFDERLARLRQG